MFLMASSEHLGDLQGHTVPTVIATQVLEPARLAIVSNPISTDGWNLATRKLDQEVKVSGFSVTLPCCSLLIFLVLEPYRCRI